MCLLEKKKVKQPNTQRLSSDFYSRKTLQDKKREFTLVSCSLDSVLEVLWINCVENLSKQFYQVFKQARSDKTNNHQYN